MPKHLVLASGTGTDGVAIGNIVGLELFLFQNSKQMQCLHPQEAGGCPQLFAAEKMVELAMSPV